MHEIPSECVAARQEMLEEFAALRMEMRTEFGALADRFDRLQRTMIALNALIVAALLGLIGTQL